MIALACVVPILLSLSQVSAVAQLSPPAATTLAAAVSNDNRRPAGARRNGVHTLHLVARWSAWTLNSETARDRPMLAFAEEGGAPTIPGPLLRARQGTRMRVSVRNPLPGITIVVRGLGDHASDARDSLVIASGATVEREFVAAAAGTFFYWGTISGATTPERRFGYDSQLNGAFIVDPPSPATSRADRIFMITLWSDSTRADGSYRRDREFWAINGKSWPQTERLNATVGDSIRWRVINASASTHPMHLHGFYFRIDSHGANGRDTLYGVAERRMAVTEQMIAGTTMQMVWSPDRSGGWVFHCHLTYHLGLPAPIAGQPAPSHDHDPSQHVERGMAGLMLAIGVRPARGRPVAAAATERRQLRLVLHSDSTPADSHGRRFAAVVQDGNREPARDSMRVPGSPIVVHRGEPTTIRVVNQSGEPTSIHWHGIELESYYDGVVGVGGMPGSRTPPVMPSDSFDVHITAPRSGTFMYHTHMDDVRQQNGGLYGPFIVLEPGATMDWEHNVVLLAANDAAGHVMLNGSAAPAPTTMHTGQTYRLRIGNITTGNPGLVMRLVRGGGVVPWRSVAKDGFELSAANTKLLPAMQPVSNGEIYDFEFTPDRPGDLLFEVNAGVGRRLVSMVIHVVR